ncbi:MAG: insulinase family protein [Acidobacteriaceae bacterium]|nr:insulinase family protein [Acidobacteriaceae bacterium]
MRFSLIRAGLALIIAAACAAAQSLSIDIPYQKFVLPNGLTVIVHEDHKAPIVAVNVWYHVGSKDEKPGKTGFAHLYEHLMFGGSENAKGSYIQAMEKIGATDLNGTTNSDRTNYFENVPTSALDYVLFMESDRMGHFINSFDKATLDQQRGVVQNEKRQGENQPYGLVWDILAHNTYPSGHPYSWTTIGSMNDLNAASLEDVKEWFRTYYGPSNTTLVLAGDIDVKTAREKVGKYFSDIPAGPPVDHQTEWVAKRTGTHRMRVQDRVPQARVYQVWNVPGFGTAEADYLALAADCLAEGKVSRLYRRLVYDDQLATDVTASTDESEIGGQFLIQATVRPGVEVAKVEAALNAELARFLTEGPAPAELQRVQTQYAARFLRGLDRIGGFGGKSDILAEAEVFTGDPSYLFKTSFRRHEEATTLQVKAVANKWLADGKFEFEVLPFPEYKVATTGVDRSKPPAIGDAPDLRLPQLQRATLSNGLKIILAERHEIPVVNFWLQQDSGYSADSFATPGTASFTSAMLLYGTQTRTAMQISEDTEDSGAQLRAFADVDYSNVRLSALKQRLDPSLDLFADVILHPTFPQDDFVRLQQQRIAGIRREKAVPIQLSLRITPALLYGPDHPYGNPYTGSGTEESVAKLTRADLVKFHQTWYRPNGATLIIVGDTTLREITPKLERAFAEWKPAALPAKKITTLTAPAKSGVYLIDQPGALQSTIVVGLLAPPRDIANDVPFTLMNDAFGGTFSGRLNMNLREAKHYSYGSETFFLDARAQRPYLALAPVQTDKTKESLAELHREYQGIVTDRTISATELSAAQSNETLQLPGSRESIDQVSASIAEIVRYNLPDDYYQTYAGKVKAMDIGGVDDAAKTLVQPKQLVWVIVGDRSKIEAGIPDLNLGPVHILDRDGKEVE